MATSNHDGDGGIRQACVQVVQAHHMAVTTAILCSVCLADSVSCPEALMRQLALAPYALRSRMLSCSA